MVTETEPAQGVRVLFLCAGVVEDGWRNAQGWWALPGWRRDGASHWMPLPATPAQAAETPGGREDER